MAGSNYGDMHRMFLQALMSRAIVTRPSALKLLKDVTQLLGYRAPIKENDLADLIGEINAKISEFGQEIKCCRAEHDGQEYVVFVNVVDSSSIFDRLNHSYSLKERETFRLLLEAVVMAGDYGSVSTTDALHLNVPNMKAGDIQDTIDKLVSDQWFLETNSGRLVPATRLIAEFDVYLKNNFHDHVNVCLCGNVVFYGVQCPHCDHISHRHCFITFNRRQNKNDSKCPSCKAVISPDTDNGEEETPQQRKRGSSTSQESSQAKRKGRTPETPINTPGFSGQEARDEPESMDVDTTPVLGRGGRKRRSDQ